MGFVSQGLYYRTPEEARAEKEKELQDEIEYLNVLDPIIHARIFQECLDKINRLKNELNK